MLLQNFNKFNHTLFWGLWEPQRDLYSLCWKLGGALIISGLHIAIMMAGYSILGSYPMEVFQAHKNLKSIYLTFGYVGVGHWAATDGQPQRWT